nr:precorrin-6y C5,15-methyltransferase (decarboxylating) subunit CbiE [Rhodoligotrophos appendicifer]
MSAEWLHIIGIGEDGEAGLSRFSSALVQTAKLVVGGQRHLEMVGHLITGERASWASPLDSTFPLILGYRGENVVILASGDPFLYGVGSSLAAIVPGDEIRSYPAVSSYSLACSRMLWTQHETSLLSLCGRPLETLAPLLHHGHRIVALSADDTTPGKLAVFLTARGYGLSCLHVMERLGSEAERRRTVRAVDYDLWDVAKLNLVGIEVVAGPDASIIPLTHGLQDDFFEHDGQMTKQEVRAVTLASLAPRAGEMLWDIGCGSGSVAIEWLLRHPLNRAIGIERRADRARRAESNARELGATRLQVMVGSTNDVMTDLPQPNAIFIGGGMDEKLVDLCWDALLPQGRLVINSVSMETDMLLGQAFKRLGGKLTRISIDRLDEIGNRHAFRPMMTVTHWRVAKP